MSSYVTDAPVNEHPSFLGREVLLKSLGEAMARNRIFVVLGAPRMGRTSVLRRLADRAQGALRMPGNIAAELRPGLAKHVVVLVDLANLGAATPLQIVQAIWAETQKTVLDPYVQSHPTPPRPIKMEILRTADPFQVWRDTAQTLWGHLANTPGWCRYSLLFDNADVLAEPALHGVLMALAESVSRTDGAMPQALGLAGGLGLRNVTQPHKKAMRAARVHTLEPLRLGDVEALGKLGQLQMDAVQCVHQAVGGHPWLLQRAMEVIQAAPERDPNDIVAELAAEFAPFFEDALGALPAPARGTGVSLERSLLSWLLARNNEGDLQEAERELGLGPLRAACDNLVGTGFLDRSVRGLSGTWLRLNAHLFTSWVHEFV